MKQNWSPPRRQTMMRDAKKKQSGVNKSAHHKFKKTRRSLCGTIEFWRGVGLAKKRLFCLLVSAGVRGRRLSTGYKFGTVSSTVKAMRSVFRHQILVVEFWGYGFEFETKSTIHTLSFRLTVNEVFVLWLPTHLNKITMVPWIFLRRFCWRI